jgi:hypothetical protein
LSRIAMRLLLISAILTCWTTPMHGQNEDSLGDDWQGRDLLFDDSVDSIPERSESISRPPTRRLPQRTPNRARPQPEPASPTVPDEENLWGEAEVEHGEQEPIPLALPEEPPDASSPWEGPEESRAAACMLPEAASAVASKMTNPPSLLIATRETLDTSTVGILSKEPIPTDISTISGTGKGKKSPCSPLP